METKELIARLASDAPAVRRLPQPAQRAALWLALSAPYVAAVVWVHALNPDLAMLLADTRFIIEQLAAVVTAVTAALAAFCSVVPGYDRRILYLPLAPLALWLATLGGGCVLDWLHYGAEGLQLRPDWDCLPAASIIGIVPMLAMVIMLRRGAPLYPRAGLVLGALAVAALGNVGMRFFHIGDASIMVLFWHFGTATILAVVAGLLGRQVLAWRHAPALRQG